MYSIRLIYPDTCSYLSIKNRAEWKTKKIAVNHAKDIAGIKSRTGIMKGLLSIIVEDDRGNIVEGFGIK